ncbi:EAL domain-containing protein [Rubrivirga marina]|uniref:EAL domain-containing protein n=1 Tax=Rubrivirga marina TaxID=1196024 RepID=A0A271J101_9BACT|nr:EAL domain-containing protein [Rubrivirga marina]PAP76987.1 hypothetical protein BSZ37_11360 [Rubrivirga marina]
MDSDAARFEIDLRYAAGRDQLEPRFRPVVDTQTEAVVGFRVEATWEHPSLGRLGPDRFLPLAEEIGLAEDLDRWVLDRACTEVAGWGGEAVDALAVLLVALSTPTATSEGLADDARAAADLSGLPPDRLALDVPEAGSSLRLFSDLRRTGLRLATTMEPPSELSEHAGPVTVIAPRETGADAEVIVHGSYPPAGTLPDSVRLVLDLDGDALTAGDARALLVGGPLVRG